MQNFLRKLSYCICAEEQLQSKINGVFQVSLLFQITFLQPPVQLYVCIYVCACVFVCIYACTKKYIKNLQLYFLSYYSSNIKLIQEMSTLDFQLLPVSSVTAHKYFYVYSHSHITSLTHTHTHTHTRARAHTQRWGGIIQRESASKKKEYCGVVKCYRSQHFPCVMYEGPQSYCICCVLMEE